MKFLINRFINPICVATKKDNYHDRGATYTEANYRYGLAGYFRKIHFEAALDITNEYFYKENVIDFGCADGPLLPSLSKYFNSVVGIDIDKNNLEIASRLINTMHLNNVKLEHIENVTFSTPIVDIDRIKTKIHDHSYKILFLLETLEHIGDKRDLYNSQINYLNRLFTLIDDDGIIVISVPKMFGLAYLFQIIGLTLLWQRSKNNFISIKTLLKASFWIDTEEIEKLWSGGHDGYNYKKLEEHLKMNFNIIKKEDIFFQILYVIKKY